MPTIQRKNTGDLRVDTSEELSLLSKVERSLTDHSVRRQVQNFFDSNKTLFLSDSDDDNKHDWYRAFQEFKVLIDGKLDEALSAAECTQEQFEEECAKVLTQDSDAYDQQFFKMILHTSSDYEGFITDMRTRAALSPY